jgi:hypothetical protein
MTFAAPWLPFAFLALFGAGDVVFDPENTAQTINVLHAAQQQIDRLGTLLGVSTKQFDQLVALATAIGNASEASAFGAGPSPRQLQDTVRSTPGLQDADLGALFDTNGLLDAFMGVPPAQWAQLVGNPYAWYRSVLVNPALARMGAPADAARPASAYAAWYGSRSAEDQANLGARSAADFSSLLSDEWLGDGWQRRVSLQGLAAGARDAGARAGQAQTLADQQHAAALLGAGTNSILLESAAQNAGAHEAMVQAAAAQNELLRDADETRRDATVMTLDMPP